jgi:putative ABC transport system permease protein
LSLALSTLLYEWRRYLAAVIALAVAGLLVLAMTGMFMGMSKSFTATIDRSPAVIIVLPPQADSLFGDNNGQPRRNIPMVYQDSEVVEVQPLSLNWAFWSNFPKDGQTAKGNGVQIVVIDPTPGAVTLPTDFGDDLIQALEQPYSVVIDRSSLGRLGVQLGDAAKLNGNRVWVRAVTDHYDSLFNASVFMSPQTAKLLNLSSDGQRVGALMVKIKNPAMSRQVVAELNPRRDGARPPARDDFPGPRSGRLVPCRVRQ